MAIAKETSSCVCPECSKTVTPGFAHVCRTDLCEWEKISHLFQQEEKPTIEMVEVETKSGGVSSRVPAEMVRVADIVVGERFRKEYKDIEPLADSIRVNGLMQFPGVDQDNNLIYGGRRLKAVERLGWTWVPVVRKKNVDSLKLREMELEENIQRSDMSWDEQVSLKQEIYKLKVQMYGEKGTGRAAANNPTGVRQQDVAEMFGESVTNFSMDLQLARAIDEIPALRECKTKDEARKKLKQMQEQLIMEELNKRHTAASETENAKPGVSTLYSRADSAFIVKDAHVGLAALPDSAGFGFINVDTPYGIDLNETKRTDANSGGAVIEHNYIEWDKSEFLVRLRDEDGNKVGWEGHAYNVAKECFRIGDNCFMTWWYAMQWQNLLHEMLVDVGWKVDPIPCIWYAGLQGQTNQPELYLARTYEPFFVCRKGQPIINKRGRSNVFCYNKLTADKKIHPTEKPVELMEELLGTFAPLGATVLVPFLGSGNDLLACYRTGRDGVGFDLNGEVKKRFLLRVAEMEGFKR